MTLTVGIAGITGKFARLIVQHLLNYPDVHIKGYCRDPSKLPASILSSPRVSITKGTSDDINQLRSFVTGTDVVICCYLGDNTLMTDGQKLLIDACEAEHVHRYIASDYCLDFDKLEYGQHPAKDPMKVVKEYLDTKERVKGVHVLIGAFMETFWSPYFRVWDGGEAEFSLSFYGDGDEVWESTTYGTAAEYVAAVAADRDAVGFQHFLGDRKNIHEIADIFANVYKRRPQLKRLGSLQDLYEKMQAAFQKDPFNIYAWLPEFYQYYCTNGQTYLKKDFDNSKYPHIKPVTFEEFLRTHQVEELGNAYQNAGSV